MGRMDSLVGALFPNFQFQRRCVSKAGLSKYCILMCRKLSLVLLDFPSLAPAPVIKRAVETEYTAYIWRQGSLMQSYLQPSAGPQDRQARLLGAWLRAPGSPLTWPPLPGPTGACLAPEVVWDKPSPELNVIIYFVSALDRQSCVCSCKIVPHK